MLQKFLLGKRLSFPLFFFLSFLPSFFPPPPSFSFFPPCLSLSICSVSCHWSTGIDRNSASPKDPFLCSSPLLPESISVYITKMLCAGVCAHFFKKTSRIFSFVCEITLYTFRHLTKLTLDFISCFLKSFSPGLNFNLPFYSTVWIRSLCLGVVCKCGWMCVCRGSEAGNNLGYRKEKKKQWEL